MVVLRELGWRAAAMVVIMTMMIVLVQIELERFEGV